MNDRIQEIKARQANITPGKWHVQPGEHFYYVHSAQEKFNVSVAQYIDPRDVMLIAHAPDDIAYLLSEVERLQRENEAMKEALEWVVENAEAEPALIKERVKEVLSHLKG